MCRILRLLLLVTLLVFAVAAPVVAQDATPAVTARTHYDQGILDAQNGDFVAAVEAFSEAIKADPNYLEAYYARAYMYELLQEYDLALSDYTHIIDLAPDNPVAYVGRANVYRLMGDFERALADHNRAIEIDPEWAVAYASRGYTYQIQGNYAQAIEDYTRALELDPGYVEAFVSRGDSRVQLGELADAIADYSQAIELDPRNAGAYFGRGNAYFGQEDFEPAIADYSRVIELNPAFPYAYVARGYAYTNLGQTEQALADLRHFVSLVGAGTDPDAEQLIAQLEGQAVAQAPTPESGGARAGAVSLAPLLVSPMPDTSAEEILGTGEATPAGDATFYFNQGVAQAQGGDYQQAIESLTRATELDPNLADAYYFRGYLYTLQDDPERALADYSRVIELAPGFPDIYRDRGSVYYFQGDIDHALDDFHEYTRLAGSQVDPQTADFIAQLESDQQLLATAEPSTAEEYYERGEANRRLRDFEAAIADYTQAVELDPTYTDAFIARASAYFGLENLEAAIADYTRAIELDPTNPALYLARGSAYHELEDAENTARDFYQWLSLNEQRTIDHEAAPPGDSFTVQMQEGYLYRIPFEAEAGQVVTVTANDADNSGVDPLIVILDADGDALVGDDDGGGNYDSLIEGFEIPQNGTYTLVVGHAGGGSIGAVEVALNVGD